MPSSPARLSFLAGKADVVCYAGVGFAFAFTWFASPGVPVNLTGWKGACQIVKEITSCNPQVPPTTEVLATFTTDAGNMVLGGALGTVQLNFAGTEVTIETLKAQYDLYLQSPSGQRWYLLRGYWDFVEPITQVSP